MNFIQILEEDFQHLVAILARSKTVREVEQDAPTVAAVVSALPIPDAQVAGKVIGEIDAVATEAETVASTVSAVAK